MTWSLFWNLVEIGSGALLAVGAYFLWIILAERHRGRKPPPPDQPSP